MVEQEQQLQFHGTPTCKYAGGGGSYGVVLQELLVQDQEDQVVEDQVRVQLGAASPAVGSAGTANTGGGGGGGGKTVVPGRFS